MGVKNDTFMERARRKFEGSPRRFNCGSSDIELVRLILDMCKRVRCKLEDLLENMYIRIYTYIYIYVIFHLEDDG